MLAVVLAGGSVLAQDVAFMGVVKGIAHQQSGPSAVGLQTDPYQFSAFVDMSRSGSVLSAAVTPPGKLPNTLLVDGESLDFAAAFGSQAGLDAAFPNGSFTLALTGRNDGTKSVTLDLAADAYPPVPTLLQFDALQSVTAGGPLVVTWQAFTGGTVNDFVQLEVRRTTGSGPETVFETAGPDEPGGLNGTTTSVTIPANFLASGQSYIGRLLFARIVDLDETSYGQGVPAIGAYFRETTFPIVTTGPVDVDPPHLWSSSPSESDGPASRQSGVAFQFSEPMQAVQSIQWTGVDGSRFTYRWSEDRQVLFCLYPEPLPPGTQISWQLNRNGFRDVAGNTLPFEPQGSFTTSTVDTSGTPDIGMAGVYKSEGFTQSPTGIPERRSEGGYGAGAFADSIAYNTILEGTLTTTSGERIALEYHDGDGLGTETQLNSKEELESVAPPGTYQLTLETVHQGIRTVSLNMPADAFPSIPEFVQLTAAQSFDPAQPLTLSWKPMVGGTANDFIGLWVSTETDDDTVFGTPDILTGQALNGTATSVTIPPGTMRPGRTYEVELEFVHPTTRDTATWPGSTVVVAFSRVTQTRITAAGTVQKPELSLTPTADGRWAIRVSGDGGINYVLEATSQLGAGWEGLMNFRIMGGSFEYIDGLPRQHRFYRVREGF